MRKADNTLEIKAVMTSMRGDRETLMNGLEFENLQSLAAGSHRFLPSALFIVAGVTRDIWFNSKAPREEDVQSDPLYS